MHNYVCPKFSLDLCQIACQDIIPSARGEEHCTGEEVHCTGEEEPEVLHSILKHHDMWGVEPASAASPLA